MGRPVSLVGVVGLLVFLGGSFAGPLTPAKELLPARCLRSWPVGKAFTYHFDGENKIKNDDIEEQIRFAADVLVSVPAECVLVVRLRNVVSPHTKFVEALQEHPVQVIMDNGVVRRLKHHPEEKIWAINAKRAIISLLQAPWDALDGGAVHMYEEDVLGGCETTYVSRESDSDNTITLEKTKQLLSCKGRFESGGDIFLTPYEVPSTSGIRTLPFTNGTYACTPTFRRNPPLLLETGCRQSEDLYLSQQASLKPGTISTVSATTSLRLISEDTKDESEILSTADFKFASLALDHRSLHETQSGSDDSLDFAVKSYCDAMQFDIRPDTGRLFGNLIRSLRTSSFERILVSYQTLSSQECDPVRLKKAFLDALGMTGSLGATRMIAFFIENEEHTEYHAQWLASLAYIANPSEGMVEAFVPVVTKVSNPEQAKRVLLPVAAMANTFCKLRNKYSGTPSADFDISDSQLENSDSKEHCLEVPSIQRLQNVLVHRLGSSCSADRAHIITALKAFGNLGLVGDRLDSVLECMRTHRSAVDMRLYAIAAFRKVCRPEVTEVMLAIYSDGEEDAEVRIAAYLNAIRCADSSVLHQIISVYQTEKTKQVGSFVFSHLRSIYHSSSPQKADLQRLIASTPVSSKFSENPTMFSQHYEISKYFDAASVGAAADASIVFSPESFLPRSIALNLTVDLFSKSVNLLELGGRIQGIEKTLEQILGPRTFLGDMFTSKRITKRATAENTDVAQFDNKIARSTPAAFNMAYHVCIFGNEVDFVEISSEEDLIKKFMSVAGNVKKWHPKNMLSNVLFEGKIDLADNVVLADHQLTASTISGIGLVANARAVSNVILKASVPASLDGTRSQVTLEPSAVVQIDASLSFDAGIFHHGLRLASTIHTSSVVDVSVINTDNEFKVRFDTPRQKIEVLNAQSEVFVVRGSHEVKILPEQSRVLDGCTAQLSSIIGLKACIRGTVPKPWYIANRGFISPYDISVSIEKTDLNMEGIEITLRKEKDSFLVKYDTPGSLSDRKRELMVRKFLQGTGFKATYQSPTVRLHLELIYSFDKIQNNRFLFTIEDRKTMKLDEYSVKALPGTGDMIIVAATCPYISKAAIFTIETAKNSVEVKSNYPLKKPLHLRLRYSKGDLRSTLSVQGIDASLKGLFVNSEGGVLGTFNINYTLDGRATERAMYEFKAKRIISKEKNHFTVTSTWTSSAYPMYNNKAIFDSRAIDDNRKHKLQVWWGDDFLSESKTFRINMDTKLKGAFGLNTNIVQMVCQVFSPALDIDWESKYYAKADIQQHTRISSELFVSSKGRTLVKLDFLFDREHPKSSLMVSLVTQKARVLIKDVTEVVSKGAYKGYTKIEWGHDGKKLFLNHQVRLTPEEHQLDVELRGSKMREYKYSHNVRLARDVSLKTETLIDGKEFIVFEVKKEDSSLAFNFAGENLRLAYSREVKDRAMDVKLEIRSKMVYARPIKFLLHKDSPSQRKHELNLELLWDADVNPEKKLLLAVQTDREEGIKSNVHFSVANLINFSYEGSYASSVLVGPNRAHLSLSGAKFEPRELLVGHSYSKKNSEVYLTYSRSGKQLVDFKGGHDSSDSIRRYFFTVSGVINRRYTVTYDFVNKVFTIEIDREGKFYQLVINQNSDREKGIIDFKAALKLPYERFAYHELTVKGSVINEKLDVTINFLDCDSKNYKFVITGVMPAPRSYDLDIAIKTDNDILKEGKAHFQGKFQSLSDFDVQLKVESDGASVLDLNANAKGTGITNRDASARLTSKWTPSYVITSKRVKNGDAFVSDLTVSKDGQDKYITSHIEGEWSNKKAKLLHKLSSRWTGEVELDFEGSREQERVTYRLHVKRNDYEIKADVERQAVDQIVITSVNVCRTPLDADCLGVTVRRNLFGFDLLRNNDLNVKIHRKPDVTFEFDGRLHVPRDVHKYQLRLLGAINQCRLGVDLHYDNTNSFVSEQSLRGYIIEREVLITRRREQSPKLTDLRYTATFDATGDDKLEFTYRRENHDKGWVDSARLSHPKMRTPIIIKSEVSKGKDPNSLIRVESELEWFRPEDKLFFHCERRINDGLARNSSLHIHIHKENKNDFNLHFTIYRSVDLLKPVFAGYYWSYMTAKKEQRSGSLRAFLGDDLKGEIDFSSPYQDDFKITGQGKVLNEEGDKEADIIHLKNGVETKGKISYNLQKLFMKAVVFDSGNTELRELEIDGGRIEKGRYKLLLSSFPGGKKTTDLGIEHTQTSPTAFHSRVRLPPEYLQRIARKAKELAIEKAGKYPIEDMKEELKARADAVCFKLRKIFEDVGEYVISKVTQIFVDIQSCLTHLLNNTTVGQRLKKLIEANKDKIDGVLERLRPIVEKLCPKLDQIAGTKICDRFPRRSRRSSEDERDDFLRYISQQVGFTVERLKQSLFGRVVSWMGKGVEDIVSTVGAGLRNLSGAAKAAILQVADIKQIADTWMELYDESAAGYVLPRQALVKLLLERESSRWNVPKPLINFGRESDQYVVDVALDIVDVCYPMRHFIPCELLTKGHTSRYGWAASNDRLGYNGTLAPKYVLQRLRNVFDGHATVIDGSHFVTFDGKHYSVASRCGGTYLLARDFLDGNFTVLMRIAYRTADFDDADEDSIDVGGRQRSLAYIVQIDKRFIEIDSATGAVTVDGAPVALPVRLDEFIEITQNSRDESIVVRDRRTLQFSVFVGANGRLAALDLRVWYFGRTAGLLGNYNREPSDDLHTPSGRSVSASDIGVMLDDWRLRDPDDAGDAERCGRGGRVLPPQLFAERSDDAEAIRLCKRVFGGEALPLLVGASVQPADDYLDLCLRVAHAAPQRHRVSSVCRVARAYLAEFSWSAATRRLPDECLTCDFPTFSEPVELGYATKLSVDFGRSADVIMVVQDAPCSAQLLDQLPAFAKAVDRELYAHDITENRYGIILFGGAQRAGVFTDPIVQSYAGRSLFSAEEVLLAIRGSNGGQRRWSTGTSAQTSAPPPSTFARHLTLTSAETAPAHSGSVQCARELSVTAATATKAIAPSISHLAPHSMTPKPWGNHHKPNTSGLFSRSIVSDSASAVSSSVDESRSVASHSTDWLALLRTLLESSVGWFLQTRSAYQRQRSSGQSSHQTSQQEIRPSTVNILQAIERSLTAYRFRPNATKSVVAFTCHRCEVVDPSGADTTDLRIALAEAGVTLHLVSTTPFGLLERAASSPSRRHRSSLPGGSQRGTLSAGAGAARPPPSASQFTDNAGRYGSRGASRGGASQSVIVGLDGETAYELRDARQRPLIGQPGLRARLRLPKDRCATMALASHGSYFTYYPTAYGSTAAGVFRNSQWLAAPRRSGGRSIHLTEPLTATTLRETVNEQPANLYDPVPVRGSRQRHKQTQALTQKQQQQQKQFLQTHKQQEEPLQVAQRQSHQQRRRSGSSGYAVRAWRTLVARRIATGAARDTRALACVRCECVLQQPEAAAAVCRPCHSQALHASWNPLHSYGEYGDSASGSDADDASVVEDDDIDIVDYAPID